MIVWLLGRLYSTSIIHTIKSRWYLLAFNQVSLKDIDMKLNCQVSLLWTLIWSPARGRYWRHALEPCLLASAWTSLCRLHEGEINTQPFFILCKLTVGHWEHSRIFWSILHWGLVIKGFFPLSFARLNLIRNTIDSLCRSQKIILIIIRWKI